LFPLPLACTHPLNTRADKIIRLNFELLECLDTLIVDGYDKWVDKAPLEWKADGFLEHNSPIVVTSRFGQNARIAAPENELHEAVAWQLQCDYSKIAFITVALATSIEYALSPSFCISQIFI
jgi:hypothetical protein